MPRVAPKQNVILHCAQSNSTYKTSFVYYMSESSGANILMVFVSSQFLMTQVERSAEGMTIYRDIFPVVTAINVFLTTSLKWHSKATRSGFKSRKHRELLQIFLFLNGILMLRPILRFDTVQDKLMPNLQAKLRQKTFCAFLQIEM